MPQIHVRAAGFRESRLYATPAGSRIARQGRLLALGGLLLAAGCRVPAPPRGAPVLSLAPDEQRFAGALAHYAQARLLELEYGGDHPDAIRHFEQAAELDPGRHRINSKIALGHLMNREPEKAIAVLEESARHHPDDLTVLTDLAVTCQIGGHFDKALAYYDRLLARDPGNGLIYLYATQIHALRQQDNKAVAMLGRGFKHAFNTRDLAIYASQRGRKLIDEKQFDRALAYFEVLAISPLTSSRELYNLIGQLNLELGRPERAIVGFRAATLAKPPLADSFTKLAAVQMLMQDFENATLSLEAGREHFPEDPDMLFRLALAYTTRERFAEAIPVFAEIEALPADHEGPTHLTQEFYLSYGAACERAGQIAGAERIFEACLDRYPDSHQAMNYLAYMWAERDVNLDQALAFVRKAIALKPENGAYIDTLGWVLYRRGDYPGALAEIEHADELIADDPVINDHLGDIHDVLGDRDRAVQYWSRSLRLDPGNRTTAIKLEAYGANPKRILKDSD